MKIISKDQLRAYVLYSVGQEAEDSASQMLSAVFIPLPSAYYDGKNQNPKIQKYLFRSIPQGGAQDWVGTHFPTEAKVKKLTDLAEQAIDKYDLSALSGREITFAYPPVCYATPQEALQEPHIFEKR